MTRQIHAVMQDPNDLDPVLVHDSKQDDVTGATTDTRDVERMNTRADIEASFNTRRRRSLGQ